MPKYFAYGSNLNASQMHHRCPSSKALFTAKLEGYQLSFPRCSSKWQGGVAGLEEDTDSHVLGAVYQLSCSDLARLDECEGVPKRYRREELSVSPLGQSSDQDIAQTAWVYIAVAQPDGPFRPSKRYLCTMISGAREHGLPEDYIEEIRRKAEAIDNE